MKIALSVLIMIAVTESMASDLLDLSYDYNDNTLLWPGGQKFGYTNKRHGDKDNWYAANDFATAEHSGTHLDAPYHFYMGGKTVEKIPLERLFVKGVIVNASLETEGRWNYSLPASVFQGWEEKHGPVPENSVVLVSFGWAHKYPNKTEYMGPSDDDLRFPGLSVEAAQWLVDTKKVVGVGLDTPSIDHSQQRDAPVHKILCSNDIYILENVALTKALPPLVDLVILPMKLSGGTGAPVRIVAKI